MREEGEREGGADLASARVRVFAGVLGFLHTPSFLLKETRADARGSSTG